MGEFISAVIQILHSLPDWVWAILCTFIHLYLGSFVIRHFFFDEYDFYAPSVPPPDIPAPDYPLRWQVNVADFFCRWFWGFKLMYFLGWAVEGRHYHDSESDPGEDPPSDHF